MAGGREDKHEATFQFIDFSSSKLSRSVGRLVCSIQRHKKQAKESGRVSGENGEKAVSKVCLLG